MEEQLRNTPMHAQHESLEARMGEQAGWRVPLSFTGPLDEAAEVRRRAGVFDRTPESRIRIRGDGALNLLERAFTHDAVRQEDDTAAATCLLNERAGVVDFGRLIRLESFWVFAGAACCRAKTLAHLQALAEEYGANVDDQTLKTCRIDVTGPAAPDILGAVLPMSLSDLAEGAVKFGTLMVARYIAARVSFSGEWGIAVTIPNMMASQAWRFITRKAGENAIRPCGSAAADILRVEAGLPAYGHELNETADPLSAGLEGCICWEHDFLGREALAAIRGRGPRRVRVGLLLPPGEPDASAVPRMGDAITDPHGREVGGVTSGAYSPKLGRPIAQAYVTPDAAAPGTELRAGAVKAQVAAMRDGMGLTAR